MGGITLPIKAFIELESSRQCGAGGRTDARDQWNRSENPEIQPNTNISIQHTEKPLETKNITVKKKKRQSI